MNKLEKLSEAFANGYITQAELDAEIDDLLGTELKEEDTELAEVWETERRTK